MFFSKPKGLLYLLSIVATAFCTVAEGAKLEDANFANCAPYLGSGLGRLPTVVERARFFATVVGMGVQECMIRIDHFSFELMVPTEPSYVEDQWHYFKEFFGNQLDPVLKGAINGKDVIQGQNDPLVATSQRLQLAEATYKQLMTIKGAYVKLLSLIENGFLVLDYNDTLHRLNQIEADMVNFVKEFEAEGVEKMLAVQQLAESLKDDFRAELEDIAKTTGTKTFFGDKRNDNGEIVDTHIVKSVESATEKFYRMKLSTFSHWPNCAPYFNDSLRGTMVVHSVAEMVAVIEKMKEKFAGNHIGFSNKFHDNYPTGYVGVHANFIFQNRILAEVQIHLDTIVNEKNQLSVQYAIHPYYEVTRTLDLANKLTEVEKDAIKVKAYQASKLFYAQAMFASSGQDQGVLTPIVKENRWWRNSCPMNKFLEVEDTCWSDYDVAVVDNQIFRSNKFTGETEYLESKFSHNNEEFLVWGKYPAQNISYIEKNAQCSLSDAEAQTWVDNITVTEI